MQKYLISFIIFVSLIAGVIFSGCTGAHVSVGVHTPGPWAGPYGGTSVSIGTGRPMSPGYYPYNPDNWDLIGLKTIYAQSEVNEQPQLH